MSAIVMSDPDRDLKIRFASAYLRLNDAMKAMMAVVSDPGKALQVGDKWLVDPVVTAEIERLLEEKGSQHFLPSKEQILVDIKRHADEARDIDAYIKAIDLYARMRGWVEKPGNVKVDVAVQSVLVVPSQGSDENWERNAGLSQRMLIDGAATRSA